MKGSWYKINVCIKCHNKLGDYTMMYSSGVCPDCGHDSDSTICDTKTIVARKIYKWVFICFPVIVGYEGRGVESQEWLNKYKNK